MLEVLKPMKVQIDNLCLKLGNASAEDGEISDKFLAKLDRDVKGVASMFDSNLKDKY